MDEAELTGITLGLGCPPIHSILFCRWSYHLWLGGYTTGKHYKSHSPNFLCYVRSDTQLNQVFYSF
jgi:hypothetical protein